MPSKPKVLIPEIWDITRLRANDWNPNSMDERTYELTKVSILEEGFSDPIDIDPTGLILDGEHRWKIALDLGMTEVPVFIKERYEDDAKITTIRKDRTHGNPDLIKLSEIVGDLVDEIGKAEVERRLGYDETEQQAMLEVTSWDWASYGTEAQDDIESKHSETVTWSVGLDPDTKTRLEKLLPKFSDENNQDYIDQFIALMQDARKKAGLPDKAIEVETTRSNEDDEDQDQDDEDF